MLKLRSRSVRVIYMLLLILVSSVCIALIAIGSFLSYRDSMINVVGQSRSDVLSQIGNRMRDVKSNAYTISNLYYNDRGFRELAEGLNEDNKEEFFSYMDDITSQYKVSFNQINLDYYAVYLSVDGIGYCSMEVPEDYDFIDPTIRIWYRDLYYADGDIIDVASYTDRMLGKKSFIAARTVSDEEGEILGYLMINVNEEQIFGLYKDAIAEGSDIYITDNDGYIISSNINKIVSFHYFNMNNLSEIFGDKDYAVVELPKEKTLLSKFQDEDYDFTVFEMTPMSYLMQPIIRTGEQMLILTGVVILIGIGLAWILSRRFTDPILKMRDYVLKVEAGNLNTELKMDSFSEINTLSQGINSMLKRIRELIESEKKKEEQKRKMQYQLLQSQINPHFIYNTLFSIKCLVDLSDNEKASRMLFSFIKLLKSTLADPDSMTSLGQQMEDLKQYADLQRLRYGESFDVIIEYEEGLSDCLLPSLLIQPLLENAIIHGVGQKGSRDGVIAVSARTKKGKLVIEVEDNGAGMTMEKAERLLSEAHDLKKGVHIGIKNIDERIKLYYGQAYGIRIESSPGEGTKAMINVPVIHKGEEVNDTGISSR